MNRGEPVSNDEGCAPAHQVGDGFHNGVLCARIQGAGRFIQKKNRCILEKGSGNANALALPRTQVASAFAHGAGEPVWLS
jgi:hypothetical protein